jgi:hypothetical protein
MSVISHVDSDPVSVPKPRRLLELFSGTKSISKAVGHHYDEVISIDILKKFKPTICTNIMDWDYKSLPPGHFDTIWSSPPCTEYSKAKTRGERKIEEANNTGKLKEQRALMADLPFVVMDYCRFGYTYRKRTCFWTNQKCESRLCLGPGKCQGMIGNKHRNSCGNGTSDYTERAIPLQTKYSIPADLVLLLFGF